MGSKNANASPSGGSGGQVSHRLRNFFRINSSNGTGSDKDKTSAASSSSALNKDQKESGSGQDKEKSRHTKFFSSTVGRLRAHTVASEGNQLEEAMSPTAQANPYFAHQGMPGLRHHDDGSIPPSPPDTPTLKISGPDGAKTDTATSETKEELARRLRRVASAPNAQGLFSKGAAKPAESSDDARPQTAELGKDPLVAHGDSGSLSLVDAKSQEAKKPNPGGASEDVLAGLPAPHSGLEFRRTYSSNSIKVRNVEVNPSSFDKIKMIGKGDVGKVYLVREKKSSRLYAMKGRALSAPNAKHS